MGLQTDSKFVFVSFDVVQQALPDIEMGDVTISLDFTGQVKFDIGPSPAAAAKLARHAAPVAGPAAAAVGVIGAAAVINGGTAVLAQPAREEGLRMMELLARRDGVASWVAYEIVGGEASTFFNGQRSQWRDMEGVTGRAFEAGAADVQALVNSLKGKGDAFETLRKRWDDQYAKGLGLSQWPGIRENVFRALVGYETDDESRPDPRTL